MPSGIPHWQHEGERLSVHHVIDDWQGPTHGILHSEADGAFWLLYLQSWSGPRLQERCYAVAELDPKVSRIYLHNVRRDYCDLTRKGMETEALVNAASPPGWLLRTEDGMITSVETVTDSKALLSYRPWQEIA